MKTEIQIRAFGNGPYPTPVRLELELVSRDKEELRGEVILRLIHSCNSGEESLEASIFTDELRSLREAINAILLAAKNHRPGGQ